MKPKLSLIFCLFVFSINILRAQALVPELEKGKILPNITCLNDKTESYAIYLPKN